MTGSEDLTQDSMQDCGVASTGGFVCQNFTEHNEEVEMHSGPFDGVRCPECGRMTGRVGFDLLYTDEVAGEVTHPPDEDETSKEKGDRIENEAHHILCCTYGMSNVDKCHRLSQNDPLYFIDIIAVKQGWPVRFVQAKANTFEKRCRDHYTRFVKRFPDHIRCEVWIRVDYQGWEIYSFDHDEECWNIWVEIDECDKSDAKEVFRETVGYYDGNGGDR